MGGFRSDSKGKRVFLSYSPGDCAKEARALHEALENRGFDLWQDVTNLDAPRLWDRQIQDAIDTSDAVLFLMSPKSVRTVADGSPVDSLCLDEIAWARCYSPTKKQIVPLLVKSCSPAFLVARQQYIDVRADAKSLPADKLDIIDQAISNAISGKVQYWEWWTSLTVYDPFSWDLWDKRKDFYRGPWLFQELERLLKGTNAGHARSILIVGDPGVGKSAIVAELAHRNLNGQVIACHCCDWRNRDTLEPEQFARGLVAQLAAHFGPYRERLGEQVVQNALNAGTASTIFEVGILGPLRDQPEPDGPRYILLDALDEALELPGPNNILTLLQDYTRKLPVWLRIVATTRDDDSVIHRLQSLDPVALRATDTNNKEDLAEYVRRRVSQPEFENQLNSESTSVCEAVEKIGELANGTFLVARHMLDAVREHELGFADMRGLTPGLEELYGRFFDRLALAGSELGDFQEIMAIVIAAEEPLTLEQLSAISVRRAEDLRVGVLQSLRHFLPIRAGHFTVWHKSFEDWLVNPKYKGTSHHISVEDGHARLIDWGLAEVGKWPIQAPPPYVVKHLTAHLAAMKRADDLADFLLDWRSLEAKVQAGMVFDLVRDFDLATTIVSKEDYRHRLLGLLQRAVRLDGQFIARHPETLFQCCWNRGWWYDCEDAKAHYLEPEEGWEQHQPPWSEPNAKRLSWLMEDWRKGKECATPGVVWVRSHRPPPDMLDTPLLARLEGHRAWVNGLATIADGRIVSASYDGTVRVWDANSGRELTRMEGHMGNVHAVAVLPDGGVVSGSEDGTVRVWDANSGRELTRIEGHRGVVFAVTTLPDGRVVSASSDGTVRVWDANSGRELALIEVHKRGVYAVAALRGGQILSGSGDGTVQTWDAGTGLELAALKGHSSRVRGVAELPDGRAVSSSDDQTLRIWDTSSGKEVARLEGHQGGVRSVAVLFDGRIVSGSADQTLRVWDANSGRELGRLEGHNAAVNAVAAFPDGRVVSGSFYGTVRLWDPDLCRKFAKLKGHTQTVTELASLPGGRLVSVADDGFVWTWDSRSGRRLAGLKPPEGPFMRRDWITAVKVLPCGRIALGAEFGIVVIWDPVSLGLAMKYQGLPNGNRVNVLGVLSNGRIVSGMLDGTVRVWDQISGREFDRLEGHTQGAIAVAELHDGRVVSGSDDETVRVWDLVRHRELVRLEGHEGPVSAVAALSDGRVVSGSEDGSVRVWGTASDGQPVRLEGHVGRVIALTTLRDGRVVSESIDQTTRIWDVKKETCTNVYEGTTDLDAVAAGAAEFPYLAFSRHGEICLVDAMTDLAVAHSPILNNLTALSSGRTWAGTRSAYLGIFSLEGDLPGL